MDTGKPTQIEYETLSGVVIHITPLNVATVKAIRLRAESVFPYPEKTEYETPLENAADPTITMPAERNPDYIALCKTIDEQRAEWANRAVIDYAATFPAGKAALVEQFQPQLERLRAIADLPDEDDWTLILFYLILSGNTDTNTVLRAAVQTVALTPGEVAESVRFFRPQLPGRAD